MDKKQFISGVCDLYDHRLLENSLTTEGNVCGVLLSDLTYFDDCGLEPKDFVTKHGRMLFTLGKQLRDKGISNFDEISLLSHINEDVKNKIENELGGFRAIQNIIDVVSVKNMDAFMDELHKRNVLMSLYKKNFNIFEEMTLDSGKKVVPYDLFQKLTSSEVLDWYNSQLASLETNINSNKIVDEGFVDFDDEFIERLARKEEVGVSFGDAGLNINGEEISTFPFMSGNILGLKPGTLNCWAAHSGAGKSTYMITVLMSLIAKGEKIILVSNESQISDVRIQFLIWTLTRCLDYWKISKKKLTSGNLSEEDKAKIKEARQWWKSKYAKSVKIVTLSDADARLTCQIIKRHILRDGCTAFLVDTFKLTTDGGSNDTYWMSLIKDTRDLTSLAMKYNVIGLMTVQLALNSLNRCWIDASCLSHSRAIKETLSNLIMFRKITDAELDPSSPYFIHPFRSKQREDGTWYEEQYIPDRSKVWRCFFIDKSRRGADSNDTGIAYLVRYDGDFCTFYETAKCRPTHKLINTEGR